jgi:hypothetical protein
LVDFRRPKPVGRLLVKKRFFFLEPARSAGTV